MYNLIIILATGITTVGNYQDQATCQVNLAQFHRQNVTAACVQQQSPEQSLAQAQAMMRAFARMIEETK
jgi:hypothetical protein